MHCNGKCILMQKLKISSAEENSTTAPQPRISMEDYPVSIVQSTTHYPNDAVAVRPVYGLLKASIYMSPDGTHSFHPPRF
jgi:hypothetical protein